MKKFGLEIREKFLFVKSLLLANSCDSCIWNQSQAK